MSHRVIALHRGEAACAPTKCLHVLKKIKKKIIRKRRDLLNNLAIKNCDKVEKVKKFKTILV